MVVPTLKREMAPRTVIGTRRNSSPRNTVTTVQRKEGQKTLTNTAECRKWNPDGTRKQYQAKSEEKKTNVNYAQFKEMQDSVKDMSKDMKRLMKRSKEASDSDQDT